MLLNITKSIKIGGLTYKVEIVDELDRACGDTTFPKQRIRIEKSDENFMRQVFIHEILHAINGEMGDLEVEFLAMALYQVIRDNPDLFKQAKEVKRKKK